jgi:hypothetical protein
MPGGYPKTVDQFRKVMLIMGVLSVVIALLIVFTPGGFVKALNWIGGVFVKSSVAPNVWTMPAKDIFYMVYDNSVQMPPEILQLPDHSLYTAMALSMTVMMAVFAFLVFYAPEKYDLLIILWMSAKGVAGLFALGQYLWVHHYFINLAVALFDLPLALAVLFFWLRARAALRAPVVTPNP